jgi:hypothetical protein
MTQCRLIIISFIGVILLGIGTRAQVDDPVQLELNRCLVALLDDPDADLVRLHGFDLSLPGDASPKVSIVLDGVRVEEFYSPRFSITKENGRAVLRANAGNKKGRSLTGADLHSLRWYLSLDPFWVIHATRDRIHEFEFAVDEVTGHWRFYRTERVLLSAPEEKVYGTIAETLVIDPALHQVVSYGFLASDQDLLPVQDMLNVYEYQKDRGPAWVRVRQSRHDRLDEYQQYTLHY